jgi:uncharacterized protein
MKIVMTGATGFIGQQLVAQLLAEGHEVGILTRNVDTARTRLPVRCVCHPWDPAAGPDPAVIRGVDALVHLAGEGVADRPWTPARQQAIRQSRVAGTHALVAAIAALPATARPRALISASAIGYYGDRGEEVLDESSGAGNDFLAQVCQAWEGETFAAQELGVRGVAVRIGVVLGKDGGALEKMLPPFQLGVGGRLGSGRQWMSWIHLDDLVGLFVFLIGNGRAAGPINGVAPAPVTNASFTAALGRALHRPAILPVPAMALRLALGEMSTILLASQRVLPRAAERLGFNFRHSAVAGALDDLCADGSHQLVREQWLAREPEEVFAFFADPYNLEKITPDFLRFQVSGVSTPAMQDGTCIDYRLSLHGVPMRWRSRIENWDPPRGFADVQIQGPYKLWHHTHAFEPYNGGTVVRDRVRYQLPLGTLGGLVAGGLVGRDLEAIFAFRRQKLQAFFPGSGTG